MQSIQFSEPIRPELVFQYGDVPIMFISNEIDGTRHFFYRIKPRTYFWMPITQDQMAFLTENISSDQIVAMLLERGEVNIIKFATAQTADVYSIDEYELQSGDVTSDFLHQPEFEELWDDIEF